MKSRIAILMPYVEIGKTDNSKRLEKIKREIILCKKINQRPLSKSKLFLPKYEKELTNLETGYDQNKLINFYKLDKNLYLSGDNCRSKE